MTNKIYILDNNLKNYKLYLFIFGLYYGYSTLIFGYLNFEFFVVLNSFANFGLMGVTSFIIQNFSEVLYQKQTLQGLNLYLVINIAHNIWLFLKYYHYYSCNFISCLISIFLITQNKKLITIIKELDNENQEKLNKINNNLSQKMNKIYNDVKGFNPEQKKMFKEALIKQMKQVMALRDEVNKKLDKINKDKQE